jgi:hypothetical protein
VLQSFGGAKGALLVLDRHCGLELAQALRVDARARSLRDAKISGHGDLLIDGAGRLVYKN